MRLKISEILKATNGKLLKGDLDKEINYISIDSRDINDDNKKAIYISIIGEVNDGHKFIPGAYENGYRSFMIDKNHDCDLEDIDLIMVEDTTKAYGDIAKYYKDKFKIKKIGITGSVGKTSTKDIVANVVSKKYNTLKNEGNLNNKIGLPKTLFNLDEDKEVAVLEMGMSFKGEICNLADIYRPDIAVITNIGLSHIGNFKDKESIFKAKMDITHFFDEDSILIVNGDDEYLKKVKERKNKYKVYSYGYNKDNDIYVVDYDIKDKIVFTANIFKKEEKFVIPSIAKHNILNSLVAILIGKLLDIPLDKIKEGLASFSITKGRLTMMKKKDLLIIDDAYNASDVSIISALDVLKMYKKRRVAVLGDILEVGSMEEEIHRNVGKNILGNADILITVGNASSYISDEAIKNGFKKEDCYHFDNVDLLIKDIDSILKRDDVVLIKASHGINLSKLVDYLDKNHES